MLNGHVEHFKVGVDAAPAGVDEQPHRGVERFKERIGDITTATSWVGERDCRFETPEPIKVGRNWQC